MVAVAGWFFKPSLSLPTFECTASADRNPRVSDDVDLLLGLGLIVIAITTNSGIQRWKQKKRKNPFYKGNEMKLKLRCLVSSSKLTLQ